MIRYEEYHFTAARLLSSLLQGMVLFGTVSWLFYRSIPVVLVSFLLCPLYIGKKRKQYIEQRRWELNLQFKDGLQSLSGSLQAGYSVENAFREAAGDLESLYGKRSCIALEFSYIYAQIRTGRTVEEAVSDFAARSGVEDIQNFSEVFQTAKRTGGNIIKIIRSAGNSIASRIEMKRALKTMAAQKKLEADIMKLMPSGIILYLTIASPGFLEPLYHNAAGVAVMTAALLAYIGASVLAEKIMNIEI